MTTPLSATTRSKPALWHVLEEPLFRIPMRARRPKLDEAQGGLRQCLTKKPHCGLLDNSEVLPVLPLHLLQLPWRQEHLQHHVCPLATVVLNGIVVLDMWVSPVHLEHEIEDCHAPWKLKSLPYFFPVIVSILQAPNIIRWRTYNLPHLGLLALRSIIESVPEHIGVVLNVDRWLGATELRLEVENQSAVHNTFVLWDTLSLQVIFTHFLAHLLHLVIKLRYHAL
mmetsp:Transcript_60511/g.129850  ORF Transcript_60511/g.129850 Transcript_60511/m.129850 type:complete len:225 (+) Transcript_60511:391-1065(+)